MHIRIFILDFTPISTYTNRAGSEAVWCMAVCVQVCECIVVRASGQAVEVAEAASQGWVNYSKVI